MESLYQDLRGIKGFKIGGFYKACGITSQAFKHLRESTKAAALDADIKLKIEAGLNHILHSTMPLIEAKDSEVLRYWRSETPEGEFAERLEQLEQIYIRFKGESGAAVVDNSDLQDTTDYEVPEEKNSLEKLQEEEPKKAEKEEKKAGKAEPISMNTFLQNPKRLTNSFKIGKKKKKIAA